ncbi:uncharacterized protein LOC119023254 [Acanthopagrus latus]|uniref:uncharacterized protein LOC119023254 n=1 Tax=Acanthopagrus latus TaxID=8177 RepID=UPI00187C0FA8|nr:uncharacterized protein LOC119023254 [Acanthopagrus latus]
MHNWQENEIKELLTIRASEAIRHQITGTVKDSAVYSRMTKLLADRGVYRTHMQVISKLKALRKQYSKYHQQKIRCGADRVDWPLYEQCHRAFGKASSSNPAKRKRSPSPPSAPSSPPPPLPPPSPSGICEKHDEVVVSLWDEVEESEMNKRLEPVEAEDDEDEQYSPSEATEPIINHQTDHQWRKRTDQSVHKVPAKRKKASMMDSVTTLVSATVAQLREMDAAMQAQEDARLQRLMDHEKEMQNNLMNQLVAMHERLNRENHERHIELVDTILSRLPSPSPSSGL